MKLKELNSILCSNASNIQMALVYDLDNNKDLARGTIEYAIKGYGDKEVVRISSYFDRNSGWDYLVIAVSRRN